MTTMMTVVAAVSIVAAVTVIMAMTVVAATIVAPVTISAVVGVSIAAGIGIAIAAVGRKPEAEIERRAIAVPIPAVPTAVTPATAPADLLDGAGLFGGCGHRR